MNDEEINETIARGNEEAVIFCEVDLQHEHGVLDNWQRASNRGKPPLPLMQAQRAFGMLPNRRAVR